MLSSINSRMMLLLSGFLLLVTASVVATFVGLQTMAKDALVINLAGRQRMLIQQMTKDALQLEKGGSEAYLPTLQEAARTFDQTLSAFIDGGQAPYPSDRTVTVPPTRQPEIRARLQQLRSSWDTFRNHLGVVMAGPVAGPDFRVAVQTIERLSPDLVRQADDVVRLYEFTSEQKLARLRWIQVAFFLGALTLLALGTVIIQRSVVHPLQVLGRVAERIGRGDLDTPVEVKGPSEIELLAQRFDAMRGQLQTSQAELTAWTKELETRVARRTRELTALYEVSREISSRLDINHVLHSVTDKARELLDGQVAFLCLLDDQGRTLNLRSVSGPPEAIRGVCVSTAQALAGLVLAADQALLCGIEGCIGSCAIMASPFQASHLAAPLRLGERVIGALCVGSRKAGAFPKDAGDLLTKLANSAAIALENARLYEQAERVATLEERQRIAAEMHDGLAQTLSYIHLQVDQVAERYATTQNNTILTDASAGPVLSRVEGLSTSLEHIRERLARAIEEVRANIADLSTLPPPPQALPRLLTDAAQEAAAGQDIRLAVTVLELEDLKVAPDVAEQIRRIVGEAVINACRHAGASRIQVRLDRVDGEAVIAVEDDGRGFEPDQVPTDGRHHFGLSTMQARAIRIGGRLMVESEPGRGTCVTLCWPLDD